jgi:hypothetical protein
MKKKRAGVRWFYRGALRGERSVGGRRFSEAESVPRLPSCRRRRRSIVGGARGFGGERVGPRVPYLLRIFCFGGDVLIVIPELKPPLNKTTGKHFDRVVGVIIHAQKKNVCTHMLTTTISQFWSFGILESCS